MVAGYDFGYILLASCFIQISCLVKFDALGEFVERDAVHKALMALLRQDVKGNFHCLQVRCKHLNPCIAREPTYMFFDLLVIRDKVNKHVWKVMQW